MINRTAVLAALAAGCSFAAADVVVSYSFTDLNGAFDSGLGLFTASAENTADLQSGGDVSSLVDDNGTAQYDTGFFGIGAASVALELDVFNITATSADSSGTVTVTDTDGDVLTASISGSWNIINPFGFMFFSGVSDDFTFTDDGDGDGVFNGATGSFSLATLADQVFDGAVSIILQSPGGFGSDFDGVSTQSDGILVPTPGALAIAGLGLAGITRRRRA